MERLQGYSDPNPSCEKCGGELRKEVSQVSIKFKGSGFHVNDYPTGS